MAQSKHFVHTGHKGNNVRLLSDAVVVQALCVSPRDPHVVVTCEFRKARSGGDILATFCVAAPLVLPYSPVGWFNSNDGITLSCDGPVAGIVVYE